ncbi:hypothetical protein VNO77_44728 [Canavalia gladiata]|uniref:Uncharacterized protein n=1 Tax=Canavalia gladiata TaxID=3824 RepID=A0AAN9JZG9_CANGL
MALMHKNQHTGPGESLQFCARTQNPSEFISRTIHVYKSNCICWGSLTKCTLLDTWTRNAIWITGSNYLCLIPFESFLRVSSNVQYLSISGWRLAKEVRQPVVVHVNISACFSPLSLKVALARSIEIDFPHLMAILPYSQVASHACMDVDQLRHPTKGSLLDCSRTFP